MGQERRLAPVNLAATLAFLVLLTSGRVHYTLLAPNLGNTHPFTLGATAWRECENGVPTITLRSAGYETVDDARHDLIWELAGALDCLDNGIMDGSPMQGCDLAWFRRVYPSLTGQDQRWERSECYSAMVTATGTP